MLLEKVCKELRVEIGEAWLGDDGKTYSINSDGKLVNHVLEEVDGRIIKLDYIDCIERVLINELKPVWRPREGEFYYVVSINPYTKENWEKVLWTNSEEDKSNLERKLIFKTKKEVEELVEKMLKVAKVDVIA